MRINSIVSQNWTAVLLCFALDWASPTPASANVMNRYPFEDPPGTTTAYDINSGMDGTLVGGAQFTGTQVDLNGTDGAVLLPAGLISTLTDASIEAWVIWRGGSSNQRVFDFGSTDGANGLTYLALTPSGPAGKLRLTVSTNGLGGAVSVDGPSALPVGTEVHLVVSYSATAGRAVLYVNGVRAGTVAVNIPLSAIGGTNNVLGRSQFAAHPCLNGRLNEFRISDTALTTPEVATSFAAGADGEAYDPGAFVRVNLITTNTLFSWRTAQAYVTADYANVSGVNITAGEGVT